MSDTTPQTADGKVLFHFAMSLDGFVAGPDHEMDWMTGVSVRPGLHEEYIKTTGAILGGRKGWDQAIDGSHPMLAVNVRYRPARDPARESR
jgi:hypothetical protein